MKTANSIKTGVPGFQADLAHGIEREPTLKETVTSKPDEPQPAPIHLAGPDLSWRGLREWDSPLAG